MDYSIWFPVLPRAGAHRKSERNKGIDGGTDKEAEKKCQLEKVEQ